MTPTQKLAQYRTQILAISNKFAVDNLRVFGSVAKGLVMMTAIWIFCQQPHCLIWVD